MKQMLSCSLALAAGCLLILAPAPARCETQPIAHTIRTGDNLHLIAGYYYGDPRQWVRLWEANRASLACPDCLEIGKVVTVEAPFDQVWQGTYEDYRLHSNGK